MSRFSKESVRGPISVHRVEEPQIDAAFRRIKPNFMGFHIWKLENDRIEMVPADQCGIFYDRDTYIIYAAAPADIVVSPKTGSREVKPSALSSMRRYVHFWLGAATTAERSGAVAYKVIDLDNHLGNVAAQYRESQHHESTRFLSYFKEGRIILSEQHADPIRLFEVRGKVSPSCSQRPVAWASFCSTSAILLQTQRHIFVWLGRSCGQTERGHALRLAQEQLQPLSAVAVDLVVVDDGYEQSMAAAPKADWNQFLSFGQRLVQPMLRLHLATDAPPAASATAVVAMKLYKCGSAAGKYRIEERKTGGLMQADLDDAAGAFIIDCGPRRGVWIWLGRSSQRRDKAEAMRNARGFVKKKQYDPATPVVRVINGHEPPEFRQLFPVWRTTNVIHSNATKSPAGKSSAANQPNVQLTTGQFDALSLAQRPRLAAQLQLIDDGTGALTVYKVHNDALLEISGSVSGESRSRLRAFFAADCYVVHYAVVNISTNNLNAKPVLPRCRHAIYLWLGSQSTVGARTAVAALAAQLHDQLHANGGGIMLVRTVQSHEPAQLLQAFAGRLAIFNGHADDYDASGAGSHLPASFLLKVCGALAHQARAVQVLAKLAHITSRDCLVLANRGAMPAVWVWCGQGSTGDAREMAKQIGAAVAAAVVASTSAHDAAAGVGEYVLVLEGSEPNAFWQCLPDQLEIKVRMAHAMADTNGLPGDADAERAAAVAAAATAASLYVVSTGALAAAGEFAFSQVVDYGQADLLPEDVFVLDAGSVVYVWLGDQCLPSERKACWLIAQSYLDWCLPTRSKDTTVAVVRQAAEPITFVGFFDAWNTLHWQTHKTVDEQRSLIDRTHHSNASNISQHTGGQLNGKHTNTTTAEEAEFNRYAKYPLDLLRTGAAVQLPELVDPLRKEMHLTHDDFVAVFAMSVAAFEALPAWRKQELKKRHKLF